MGKNHIQLKRELTPKFPKHDIVGINETGNHVVLLCKASGSYAGYAFDESDNGFNDKRMYPLSCTVSATFSDGSTAVMALDEVLETVNASMNALAGEVAGKDALIDTANRKAEAAENKVNAMETERNAERVALCKKAVQAAAAEDTDVLVGQAELDGLVADIEGGKYTLSVNASGVWNGKEMAVAAYDALYGAASRSRAKTASENRRPLGIWPDMHNKMNSVSDLDAKINEFIGGTD
jgi:hypothetical protein